MFQTEPEARPQRPLADLSPRQGDRRLVRHQRHDLDARTGRRLRPLAPARPDRLGLGRRAAGVPAAGRSFPGRERASRHRRRLAHRGAAAVLGHSGRRRRCRRADGHPQRSPISTPATTTASAISTSTRSADAAGRRRAGFLKPALGRPNLRLETNVLVDRLIVEDGRAVGVRFLRDGQAIEARARGEVILCAGSIGSMQVLQRSGIGPAEWLAALGIATVLDRPGVGRNLQDHLQQRAIYKVEGVRTLNETYYSLVRRGLMGLDYAFRRRGPLTMAPSQLGIFTRSDPRRERANIQFHVQPLSLDKFGDPLHRFPAITVSACNLRPTSRGTVRIRSTEPAERARDRAELSVHRRRPPRRRRRHPHHAAADAAAGAGALSAAGIPAGPLGRRRRRLARQGRRRHRHHHLPSRRHREDGHGQRSLGGGRRAPALSWASRACG